MIAATGAFSVFDLPLFLTGTAKIVENSIWWKVVEIKMKVQYFSNQTSDINPWTLPEQRDSL
jgi:hypothetical protein